MPTTPINLEAVHPDLRPFVGRLFTRLAKTAYLTYRAAKAADAASMRMHGETYYSGIELLMDMGVVATLEQAEAAITEEWHRLLQLVKDRQT